MINPNISDIAASALFTAFKEFQKSQQIRAFFSHQRHKRALDGITASTRIIAVNIPNEQEINNDWRAYKVSVDQLENLTGYDFFSNVLPEIQLVIESKVDS